MSSLPVLKNVPNLSRNSWALCVSALFVGLLARDAEALRGRLPAVPLERVGARKEVPAIVAEEDL